MAGNNGRTLTGTFNEIFGDADYSDFEGLVFEDAQNENSLKNSESEDSVISIIVFYNIPVHGTYKYVDLFILYKNVITHNRLKCEYHWVKCL